MLTRKPVPRWVSAVTILTAAALLMAPIPMTPLESIGTQVFAPIQLGASSVLGGAQSFWSTLRRVSEIADQNEEYRREIDRLESELVRLKELELENEVLRRLLDLKQHTGPGELLPVRVIANDVSPFVQGITIDRGTGSGVERDMPVVTWKGLVGRIIRANAATAKVLLLTDVNSSVSVRVQDPSSRATGVVRGSSDGSLLMEHVPQQERLAPGQLVITSGLGGVFPEGLVVGTITDVIHNDYEVFQRATVRPAVDVHRLEHLYVLLERNARQPE